MSITEKQLKANQENALKSTGPKSEEGKKVVSKNNVKHGLNSAEIVINSPHLKENKSEYDILVTSLIDELRPQSSLQQHLVYKIANCHWRYRRVITAETAAINRQLTPERSSYEYYNTQRVQELEQTGELDDFLNSLTIPKGNSAELFRRYEWRLNRELHHAYTLLRLLKITEKAESLDKKSQSVSENINSSPKFAPSNSHSPQMLYDQK